MKESYAQIGRMSRFILKRDRLRIIIWIMALAAFTFLVASSFTDLYATDAARQGIAETMKNPAMTAIVGKGYGLTDYTIGAMMAHQMLLFTALAVAVMNILLVARHTRSDEENGTMEMLLALPIGRQTSLAATMVVNGGLNLLLALIIGCGLYALRIDSLDLEGSLLYGAALGVVGIFFAAVTALFAQLSDNVRGTIGLSFALLGISYVLRAAGDLGDERLTTVSPLGLATLTKVYVHNEWWPLFILAGIGVVSVILAFYLHQKRDMGAGLLSHKKGRMHASVFLQGPVGLFARLQRTALVSWALGLCLLGASYGSVLGDIESFFEQNEMIAQMMEATNGSSLTTTFVTMIMSVLAIIGTIPVITAVLKIKGEEKKGRIDHFFSRPISRTRLLSSATLLACIVALTMMSLAAIGLGVVGTSMIEKEMSLRTFYEAGMVYVPAILVMMSITVLLIGVAPKLTGLTWIYLLYSFVVVYLGGLLQFPDWMAKLTPFGHVPQLPVEEMDWMAMITLLMIAVGCTAIGFSGYQKRDIQ
ncbi:ABC transporter permease [Desmospora activa]|uniref:ABC-2 type transport system permease protein n=1 Tax=Desmospora activa DSM 45169 TaxID=1121389 RepID=A0A2T4Z7J1_9BACL|nr:ABC transporter permease [Desmospora activa]PTM57835.1 ABC-2 type transport system permease protein [Desmospora activa DSM 45169]